MSVADYRAIEKAMKHFAKLGDRFGKYDVQSNRFYKDSIMAHILGVQNMNMSNTGWDGQFDNGVYFENKNNSIFGEQATYRLVFQDTSESKVQEMKDGVIVTNTFWLNDAIPGFFMMGNTKNVGDQLGNISGMRRNSSATFSDCHRNGFKIVAVGLTRNEVLDVLRTKQPTFASNLSIKDIYTTKNVPALLEKMM